MTRFALVLSYCCEKSTDIVYNVAPTIQDLVNQMEKRVPWKLADIDPVKVETNKVCESVNISTYLALTNDEKWDQNKGCICDEGNECTCPDSVYGIALIISSTPCRYAQDLFARNSGRRWPDNWCPYREKRNVDLRVVEMDDDECLYDLLL